MWLLAAVQVHWAFLLLVQDVVLGEELSQVTTTTWSHATEADSPIHYCMVAETAPMATRMSFLSPATMLGFDDSILSLLPLR